MPDHVSRCMFDHEHGALRRHLRVPGELAGLQAGAGRDATLGGSGGCRYHEEQENSARDMHRSDTPKRAHTALDYRAPITVVS